MIISEDTQAVVEYLDHFTEHNLRKKNDVAVILEVSAASLNHEFVSNLSFHGASMWKIFGLMRKSSAGSEGFAQLEQEFSNSMNEIRTTLMSLCELMDTEQDAELIQRFSEIYLGMNPGVIRNITDLAHDLSQFKEMQNQIRRSEK